MTLKWKGSSEWNDVWCFMSETWKILYSLVQFFLISKTLYASLDKKHREDRGRDWRIIGCWIIVLIHVIPKNCRNHIILKNNFEELFWKIAGCIELYRVILHQSEQPRSLAGHLCWKLIFTTCFPTIKSASEWEYNHLTFVSEIYFPQLASALNQMLEWYSASENVSNVLFQECISTTCPQ